MRSVIFRGIVTATTALTAACSSTDSVAPITRRTSAPRAVSADVFGGTQVSRAIDQNVWLSCANGGAGEAVRVTGDLRYDVQRVTDASGVIHFNITSNSSNLTAVGLTTGTFFRGLMTERVNSRAEDYLNMDLRTDDIIRFVATGSRDAYSLIVSSRFVVDQGDYVLTEQTWEEVCR